MSNPITTGEFNKELIGVALGAINRMKPRAMTEDEQGLLNTAHMALLELFASLNKDAIIVT